MEILLEIWLVCGAIFASFGLATFLMGATTSSFYSKSLLEKEYWHNIATGGLYLFVGSVLLPLTMTVGVGILFGRYLRDGRELKVELKELR